MKNRKLPYIPVLLVCFTILVSGCAGNAVTSNGKDDAALEQARKAYLAGEYTRSAAILQPLAEKGDSQARYALGYMYYYGQGVKQDFQKAILLISQAAAANHSKASEALQRISGKENKPATIDLTTRGLAKSAQKPVNQAPAKPVVVPAPPPKLASPKPAVPSPPVVKPVPANSASNTASKESQQSGNTDNTFPPAYVIAMAAKNPDQNPDTENSANQKNEGGSNNTRTTAIPTTKSDVSALSGIDDEHFTIQVTSGQNSQHVKDFLRQHKLENAIIVEQMIKGKKWHSVITGDYSQLQDAKTALAALQQKGFKDAWIQKAKDIKKRAVPR